MEAALPREKPLGKDIFDKLHLQHIVSVGSGGVDCFCTVSMGRARPLRKYGARDVEFDRSIGFSRKGFE